MLAGVLGAEMRACILSWYVCVCSVCLVVYHALCGECSGNKNMHVFYMDMCVYVVRVCDVVCLQADECSRHRDARMYSTWTCVYTLFVFCDLCVYIVRVLWLVCIHCSCFVTCVHTLFVFCDLCVYIVRVLWLVCIHCSCFVTCVYIFRVVCDWCAYIFHVLWCGRRCAYSLACALGTVMTACSLGYTYVCMYVCMYVCIIRMYWYENHPVM
jgi:hypothetical protein